MNNFISRIIANGVYQGLISAPSIPSASNPFVTVADLTGSTVIYLDPVIDQQNSPPGGPTTGDRYLVDTVPTGAWVGNANSIAEWNGASWDFTVPVTDNVVEIINDGVYKRYNGSAWVAFGGTSIIQGGNTLATNVIVGAINAKALQFKTTNLIRGQFLAGGQFNIAGNSFFGNISTTATARIHIRGVGSTGASYALKVENSGVSSLLAIQNDGYIGAGILLPLYPFHISSTLDSNEILMVQSSSSQSGITIKGQQYPFLNFFSSTNQYGQLVATPTSAFILRFYDNFNFQRFTGNNVAKVDNSNNWYFANPNPDTFVASARIHIQGFDATSSNYGLKIEDSSSTTYFCARNDGFIGVGATAPSNVEVFQVFPDGGMAMFGSQLNINKGFGAGIVAVYTLDKDFNLYSSPSGSNTQKFNLFYRVVGTNYEAIQIANTTVSFGDLLLMKDGGNVGIGIAAPTATTHIVGIDATSSNYSIKVDNSGSSPLLYVRNDTFVGIGVSAPSAGSPKFEVRGNILAGPGTASASGADIPLYLVRTDTGSPNYFSGMQLGFEVGGGPWGIGINYVQNSFQFLGTTATRFTWGGGTSSSPENTFIFDGNGGYFGINKGGFTYSATIHAQSNSATDYIMKLDNSTPATRFSVHKTGFVNINSSHDGNVLDIVTTGNTCGLSVDGVTSSGYTHKINGVIKTSISASGSNILRDLASGIDYHIRNSGGSPMFSIVESTGKATFVSTIKTADPGAGAGEWLLGQPEAASVALDTANYVAIKIDGVAVKLAIVV